MTQTNGSGKDTFIKILLVLVGLLAGFGFSQIAVVGRVAVHEQAISDLKTSQDRLFARLNTLVDQNSAIVNQNTNLIQLYLGSFKK